MASKNKYWKGMDELQETQSFQASKSVEFPEQNNLESILADDELNEASTGRRDFLKFLGFSVAAATVAACEAPVIKAVPYVMKPENVIPGMPTWYASTYYDGSSYASILVKTREARPIFIKGNKDFGITNGSVTPQVIASVLGLYDSERLQSPLKSGKATKWSTLDKEVKSSLKTAKNVVLISNTVISPSVLSSIDSMAASIDGDFDHIQYDPISYSAIRRANELNYGKSMIASYDFSKAKTIVSVGADFLSTWLMPTEFASQYGETRNPDAAWMSKHFQFESVMSVTGSNADYRAMTKPSEEEAVLNYILSKLNGTSSPLTKALKTTADLAITALKSSGKESLVVCGSNNTGLQQLVNEINNKLDVNGTTIDLYNELNLFKSEDGKMLDLVDAMSKGKAPDVVLVYNSNPVYSLPNGLEFAKGLKAVKTTVSMNAHADETGVLCKYAAPVHHALESWMDFRPKTKHYALAQPMITPIHNTASVIESFLVWSGTTLRPGKSSTVAYDKVKETFSELSSGDFDLAVHNSCTDIAPSTIEETLVFNNAAISKTPGFNKGLEIVAYQKTAIRSGEFSNNPWLHELPDPITKATWDNYITMNPVEMSKAGYATTFDQENGLSMASITSNGIKYKLPVYPSPGQALGTVGVALGYGRGGNGEKIGKAAYQTKEYGGHVTDAKGNPKPIGENAFKLLTAVSRELSYANSAKITKVEGEYIIAATQIHHTVMGRHSIVRETTKGIYDAKGKESYNPAHTLQTLDADANHVEKPVGEFDLWDAHPVENIGHRWGMTIDLSSCIGCSNCLVACQSENNVPVVGKDEVRRGREMHWLRIDRYFASDQEAAVGTRKDKDTFSYSEAEIAALNPKVVHMPMMCQHCNHAPCETVCPVAATTHSNEGLNQMTYNRCIGTRYCANNCPYKVRRFNWFNYPAYKKFTEINPAQDDLGRMVLNPDVTVRTRGVMEKCSFCVQRIQSTKLEAKKDGVPVADGKFATACSDVCPTNAIVVGDWNDIESKVRKSSEDKRSYQALEEVGVKPNVWYKVKVRNEENDLLAKLQVEKKAHH
ncbi:MAG: TAT-variant-translocated molybdopterin oxidoreductase [Crocinitomicaceae bacterium]|nr:TAT-variant-translocated molybdopterin oxidoreductase [Crocinitomicaceae bacterium]MDG1735755.1 TAT-variant-translocated molybdopterin oxidoreductase [Crocinitomicaceae bacterium]MDG2505788.1 TAT-variant-translocated molybdopterin oxidoreductase [Crocinitomicaceae bacterium]